MSKITKVCVVGAGPAGLAAAHAAAGMLGIERVTVYAPKKPTEQRGPLLLQRPIPGINDDHPDGYIRQFVVGGSILDYRDKTYGDINVGINGDVLEPGYHAWHFMSTYKRLWHLYADCIIDKTLTAAELAQRAFATSGDTLWVNTAPRDAFCEQKGKHRFTVARVFITPVAVFQDQPDDTIIFNADPDEPWCRSSRIFGSEVTEWPATRDDVNHHFAPDGRSLVFQQIAKPISTDCDCLPNVLKTGRFGQWRNQTWVDTAYYDVRNALISDARADDWSAIITLQAEQAARVRIGTRSEA